MDAIIPACEGITGHERSDVASYHFCKSTNFAVSLAHYSNTYIFTTHTFLTSNTFKLVYFPITLALGKARQVCQTHVVFLHKTKH